MPSRTRVYVGNLASDTRERDVERFFKGYGKIREISLKNGYGFVEFDDDRDADDAVHDLDGKQCVGMRVRVELAKDSRYGGRSPNRFGDRDRGDRGGDRGGIRRGIPPGRKTEYRIIVENLASRTSWQDLKDFFRAAGEITYTNAHKPRHGEGLVEFGDRRAMEYALDKLDGSELDGRRIKLVEESKSGGGGRRSRSYSRSRSRSRSRSASRGRDRGRSRSGSRD